MDFAATAARLRHDLAACWRRPELRLQALLLAPCVLLFLAVASASWEQVIDDAFITFRFSRNLVQGHGLTFNPGMAPVEGYTNFTWMLLSAAVIALGGDVLLWTKLAGLACGVATLAAAWRLTAQLRGTEDPLNVLPALFLAVNAHFAFWCVQGLETPLATLLVLAATGRALAELAEEDRVPLSPVLAALAWMTRPDTAVFLLPAVALALWLLVNRAVSLRRVAVLAGIALALMVPYQAWRVATFGDWLPNTYHAKLGGGGADVGRALAHLHEFYLNQAGWQAPAGAVRLNSVAWTPLVLGALMVVLLLGRGTWRVLVGGMAFCQTAYLLFTGADWMPGFRFFHVLLPFLGVAIALAVETLGVLAGPHRLLRHAARTLVALLLLVSGTEQLRIQTAYVFGWDPIWVPREEGRLGLRAVVRNYAAPFQPDLLPVTEALLLHTQDGATILMSDIGLPLWASPHLRLVDVDGLTDKVVADAPGVRTLVFGGIAVEDEDDILRDLVETATRQRGSAPDPESLRWQARQARRDAVVDRAVAYTLEVHDPAYILAFEAHDGLGPDAPGFIYPEFVARTLRRAGPEAYAEVWRGLKTDGDVWNHLLARRGVPEAVPPEAVRGRLLAAVESCPRVGAFVRLLYREFPDDVAALEVVRSRSARFARDPWFVRDVLFTARGSRDAETALPLYERAAATEMGTETWLHRMMLEVLLARGDWQEAASLLEAAVGRVPPDDTTLLHDLAWLREKHLGDLDGAAEALQEVLRRDPEDSRAADQLERLRAPAPTSTPEPTS